MSNCVSGEQVFRRGVSSARLSLLVYKHTNRSSLLASNSGALRGAWTEESKGLPAL
jgi:hypothetical protein